MMTAIEFVASLPTSLKYNKSEYDDRKASLNIKVHLIERKKLHYRCRQLNDLMCIIALFGIILMIIDIELRLNEINTTMMISIRLLIGISTFILVLLVLYYHALGIRLYTINNHLVDWRVTLNIRTILIILCEVLLCLIHPFPYNDKTTINQSAFIKIFVTLPMFSRLYLIARSITLHSPLVNAASSRTIGYLNRVPISISFILRAFLQTYPAGSWMCVMIVVLLISTWSLRVCEKGMWLPISPLATPATSTTSTFPSSMWFTIVTFTTVGYGDVVPQTYCGQGVSILTALFGMFAAAVLIAVFTSKISLNRSEQVVLDFVDRINRARQYRKKTMEIILYSVRAWFLKRNGHHYRATFNSLYRLHTAIRQAKIIKQEQRNAIHGNESLMTLLSDVHDEQKNSDKSITKLKFQMDLLEDKISKLDRKLDQISNFLTNHQRQYGSL